MKIVSFILVLFISMHLSADDIFDSTNSQKALEYAKQSQYLYKDPRANSLLRKIDKAYINETWSELEKVCPERMGVELRLTDYHKTFLKSDYVLSGREVLMQPNLGSKDYYKLFDQDLESLRQDLKDINTFGFHGANLNTGYREIPYNGNGTFQKGITFCDIANLGVIQNLKSLGKAVSIEVGSIKTAGPWKCSPAFAANVISQHIDRIRMISGHTPDFVTFDEPLKEGCENTYINNSNNQIDWKIKADAFSEMYHYLKIRYPSVKFNTAQWYPGRFEGFSSFDTSNPKCLQDKTKMSPPECVDGMRDILNWLQYLDGLKVSFDNVYIDVARGRSEYSVNKFYTDAKKLRKYLNNVDSRLGFIFWSPASTREGHRKRVFEHYENEILNALNDTEVDVYPFWNWSHFEKFDIPHLYPSTLHIRGTSQLEIISDIIDNSNTKRAKGFFNYNSSEKTLQGWACVEGVNMNSNVAIYLGGPMGSKKGRLFKTIKANEESGQGVKRACGVNKNLNFEYKLSEREFKKYKNKVIYIHQELPNPSSNPQLSGSGVHKIE